ncbi:MAG: 3-deoxy-manno-octulosonate cytidylyltransferase [Gemmatimonadaceae bacterium]|nr:3-deoxy-manno-octulosonate cytidylyltransferase [Gemmatimonadaceae bacterium]
MAVIPARRGATRLPDKPLRLLGGRPLVVRVLERARALGLFDRIWVATDDLEIRDAVVAAGGDAVLTRADHPSGTDRVAEVVAQLGLADDTIVCNVQGDEPFVERTAVAGALEVVRSGRAPIGTVAVVDAPAILAQPDVVKVVVTDDGRALYFSRAPIPFLRDAADAAQQAPLVRRHLGVYAYRADALRRWVALPPHPLELTERLEQLRPLAAGLAIGVADAPPPRFGGIDTEADLVRANAEWADALPAAPSIA